ncbi:hypothetical protein ABZ820_15085 [Streptomyces diacarni]|nr:hypothetical protein [Streptomyces diacarni]
MSLREQWQRRRVGRTLTTAVAGIALLLLLVVLVLMLTGHYTPPDDATP